MISWIGIVACNQTKDLKQNTISIQHFPQDAKLNFLLNVLFKNKGEERISYLKDNGYKSGIYKSIENLSDGTQHITQDTGFQINTYTSEAYEFIHFLEPMNYSTNKKMDWLIFKTRNIEMYSVIKEKLAASKLENPEYEKYQYQNIKISIANDRIGYLDGANYKIYSLILSRQELE